MPRYRKHKKGRGKGKAYRINGRNGGGHPLTSGESVLYNEPGPLTGADRVTEDRRLTEDTAIGTGTALTHKPKHFIGGKHRITNTKGDGDRVL